MTKLSASGIATAFALVMIGGSAISTQDQQATRARATSMQISEPAGHMRLGQCRIEYDALAGDRQPAPMECEHAQWVAQRWGGRVMEKTSEGLV